MKEGGNETSRIMNMPENLGHISMTMIFVLSLSINRAHFFFQAFFSSSFLRSVSLISYTFLFIIVVLRS